MDRDRDVRVERSLGSCCLRTGIPEMYQRAPRKALALAGAACAALLGLIAVASSLHGARKTALIGGIQMGG